jgi:hypothetical protein
VARFLSLLAQTEEGRQAVDSGAVDRLAVLALKRSHYSQESTAMRALDRALGVFAGQCGNGNRSVDARREAPCMQLALELAGTGAQVLLPCMGLASSQPMPSGYQWMSSTERAVKQSTADSDQDWALRLRMCLMFPSVSRRCPI